MSLYRIVLIVSSLLCLISCGERKTVKTTQVEERHEETNLVSLTDEQMKAANIVIGSIELKNLTTAISVNGTLEVPSQNKALVTSLVGGVVRSINVQPGDYMQKGQVIGTIANTEVSGIQQQLLSINAQLRFAEQELKRQRELVAGNAAPYKNVQRTESEISGLRAQRSALQRQLAALGVSSSSSISSTLAITAPINGNISEITAQIGSNIDPNAPIAQIINNSELHLDLFVYEKDLPKVASGQMIHFTLTNNPGKEYDARIYSIGTAFLNETRAVPVHAHVINEKTGLIEGMSVTARISLGENVYPAVPDEAIVSNAGKDYIFILTNKKMEEHPEHQHEHEEEHKHEGNTKKQLDMLWSMKLFFERVQVIKGASDIGFTEIRPVITLPTGAKVVIKGAFFLMAKMTNAGEAHGH